MAVNSLPLSITFEPSTKIVAQGFFALAGDLNVRSLKVPLQRAIKEVIAPAFVENFNTAGHGAWAELDEDTKKPGGDSVLVRTGRLRKASGQLNLWSIKGTIAEAIADRADDLGVGYGNVHLAGAESVNIPQRNWQSIEPQDLDRIEQVFGKWLDERTMRRLQVKPV